MRAFSRVMTVAFACASLHPAQADERKEPRTQAVELIVPFGTGGGADGLARETAKLLGDVLATPIKVTNIVGKTGNVAMAKLIATPADGTTLAVLTADTFALLAYLNPGWKESDVVPLAVMMQQPSALFLPKNSRFKTWSDFEKEARLHPGTLRVAITGLGSPDYLTLQRLASKGIRLVPVPLSNPEERYRAPAGGKADAIYEQLGDVKALIGSGELRPVLFFSPVRIPGQNEVPASGELGFGDGFDQFRAIIVKAGTDPTTIKTLCEGLDKVASMPQYKAFLANEAASTGSYLSAKDAPAFMRTTLTAMRKVVDALPFHSQYVVDAAEVETYVEPF